MTSFADLCHNRTELSFQSVKECDCSSEIIKQRLLAIISDKTKLKKDTTNMSDFKLTAERMHESLFLDFLKHHPFATLSVELQELLHKVVCVLCPTWVCDNQELADQLHLDVSNCSCETPSVSDQQMVTVSSRNAACMTEPDNSLLVMPLPLETNCDENRLPSDGFFCDDSVENTDMMQVFNDLINDIPHIQHKV